MGINFLKLRTKARVLSVFISIVLGIGVGSVALAAAIITAKLTGSPVGILCYIIGIAAFVLATALFILILLPSSKRLARQLDENYGMNEKARTMLELASSRDVFAKLQREDADAKFAKLKFRPFRKGHLIAILLTVVISASSLAAAFVIPAGSAAPPEQPIGEFDKQKLLTSITELINTVERSLIEEGLKSSTLGELRSLYDFVEEHDYMSEMKIEATRSVIALNSALVSANTADKLGEALSNSTGTTLKELGEELKKLNGNGVKKKLSALKSELEAMQPEDAAYVAGELAHAIQASGAAAASPLIDSFSKLSSALNGYSNGSVSSIKQAFAVMESKETDAVGTAAYNMVMIQGLNKVIIQTVISRLCSIFAISPADIENEGGDSSIDTSPPAQAPDEEYEPDHKEENDEIGSGGIGTGDRVYGSNDVIYNPYTNEYVPYGQVLDEYNNRMLELIQDGKLPIEFEDFIQEYFRSLSSYTPTE